MKKFSTILAVLLLSGFVAKAQEYLSLTRTELQFSHQLSSDTLTVFSNTNWTCGFDRNWLSASSAGGTGDSTISITATANPSTTSRTAHLTVSATGVASQTVTITQAGSPLLSVSVDSLVIEAINNSTGKFKITSFPDWSATSSQPWLALNPSSFVNISTYPGVYYATGVRVHPTAGPQPFVDLSEELTMVDSVTFQKAYAGNYPYQTQIKITENTIVVDGKTMIMVNVAITDPANPSGAGMLATDQNGNSTNYYDPSTRTFHLSYYYNTAAPRKIYEVLTGVATVTTVTLTVTVSANLDSSARQALITITASGVPDKIVKVTQEGLPVLAVSTQSVFLSAAAGSTSSFNINSLTNWTVERSEDWVVLDKTSGSNNDTLSVTATANSTSITRTAIITVKSITGISRTINVIQYGVITPEAKWNQIYTGHSYTEISVVNDSVIWLSRSAENTISYTTDGGTTWNTRNLPSNIPGNTAFCAVSETTAYIANYSTTATGLFKTTDGAITWTLEPTGFNSNQPTNYYGYSFPDFVYFWDKNDGLTYGDDNEIYITNNGGAQWNRVISPVLKSTGFEWSLAVQSSYKVAGNTIFIKVYPSRILKSNDRGLTWSAILSPTTSGNVSFDFKDDNNGLLVDFSKHPSVLYATTNGGQTWSIINSSEDLNYLKYIPSQNMYVSTNGSNGFLYSVDEGLTWNTNSSFNFTNVATYNCVLSPDGLTSYMTGNGYIYSSRNVKGVNVSFDNVTITSPTTLDLSFSNNVDLASSQDTANYVLTYNSGNSLKSTAGTVKQIKIISAVRDNSDFALVHLTTETALPVDTIALNVNNVKDMGGFPTINGSTSSMQTFVLIFALSDKTMAIGAEANSTNTFSVSSNLPWEITCDQSWLSTNITSGSGNSIITLTAASNNTSVVRAATVTVSIPGLTSQTITVNQDVDITGAGKFENSGISIFPNPAKNILFINGLPQNASVAICDLTGQIIINNMIPVHQIDVDNLAKGMYILKVIDKNRVFTTRFVKQ
jgi:photosystem II stability/assembly factor-like uncharacterized protein